MVNYWRGLLLPYCNYSNSVTIVTYRWHPARHQLFVLKKKL